MNKNIPVFSCWYGGTIVNRLIAGSIPAAGACDKQRLEESEDVNLAVLV